MNTHSRFSPSASARDLACPGALALIEALPASERGGDETIHTRRGTCAHTVGELCLQAIVDDPLASPDANDYIGMEIEGVIVDDKIADAVQVYVDYCEQLMAQCDIVEIEQRHDMTTLLDRYHILSKFTQVDGAQMGGTADFIGVRGKHLYVVDYKNGHSIVEVEDNTQLLSYGVQVLIECLKADHPIDYVTLTIVQPNGLHADGPVRSWEVHRTDLLDWAECSLLPGYEKCLQAVEAYQTDGLTDAFTDQYIMPGEKQCQWCPVKQAGKCPAHNNYIMESGLELFVDDVTDDIQLPLISALSEEQERLLLDNTDRIIAFLHSIRTRRHQQAERGQPTEGWKLVNVNTHRQIRKGQESAIKTALKKYGIPPHEYLKPPVLLSPAQLEKLLKRKGVSAKALKTFDDKYFVKPDGGTRFVPESAAGIAVQPAIESEFEAFFDEEDLLA